MLSTTHPVCYHRHVLRKRNMRSAAVLALACTGFSIACNRARETSAAGTPASTAAKPSGDSRSDGYIGELPPLPKVEFASARPAPVMRAAYEFAARHPDVLRHIPCFCGCERNGHGNNADCFVTRRAANGRPEWNPHGIG